MQTREFQIKLIAAAYWDGMVIKCPQIETATNGKEMKRLLPRSHWKHLQNYQGDNQLKKLYFLSELNQLQSSDDLLDLSQLQDLDDLSDLNQLRDLDDL